MCFAPSPHGQWVSAGQLQAWDGSSRVSIDELTRRIRTGELKYSPAFKAEAERLRQQMVNLEGRIYEIQRDQLHPRLRGLLTTEQLRALDARRAGTRPAASQPIDAKSTGN